MANKKTEQATAAEAVNTGAIKGLIVFLKALATTMLARNGAVTMLSTSGKLTQTGVMFAARATAAGFPGIVSLEDGTLKDRAAFLSALSTVVAASDGALVIDPKIGAKVFTADSYKTLQDKTATARESTKETQKAIKRALAEAQAEAAEAMVLASA